MTDTLYVLNGPNLDLLGEREPELYGSQTLADVDKLCMAVAQQHGARAVCRQTNAEHQLIEWLHEARQARGVVINPAGFSYHAVAVLDALRACECPIVEVHISNVYRRDERWRRHSLLATAATGVITGLGIEGYRLAIEYLLRRSQARSSAG